MNKLFGLLLATSVLAAGTAVFGADEDAQGSVNYKNNGGYDAKLSSSETTPEGTYKSSKTNVDVDVDSNGKTTKEVKTKTVNDPKGLMNKKTTTSDVKVKEKANGGYKKTAVKKSTDNGGPDTTKKSTTDVDIDKQGNVTSTTETKDTVNKGLLDKTTTTTKSKTVNGQVIEDTTQTK